MPAYTMGLLLVIFSQLGFAVMDSCIKALSGELPLATILFFRNVISLLIVAPIFFKTNSFKLSLPRIPLHLFRSGFGLISMYLGFLSLRVLPFSESSVLRATSPLFIPILAFIWLKEPLRKIIIPCLILSFSGIILLSGLDKPEFSYLSFIPIGAGLFAAFAMIAIKQISRVANATEVVFYFSVFGTLASILLGIFSDNKLPNTLHLWEIILSMGALAVVSQLSLTKSAQYVPASILAPFYYLNAVFGSLISHFFWGEKLGFWGWIGAGLVIFAGLLLAFYKKNKG